MHMHSQFLILNVLKLVFLQIAKPKLLQTVIIWNEPMIHSILGIFFAWSYTPDGSGEYRCNFRGPFV